MSHRDTRRPTGRPRTKASMLAAPLASKASSTIGTAAIIPPYDLVTRCSLSTTAPPSTDNNNTTLSSMSVDNTKMKNNNHKPRQQDKYVDQQLCCWLVFVLVLLFLGTLFVWSCRGRGPVFLLFVLFNDALPRRPTSRDHRSMITTPSDPVGLLLSRASRLPDGERLVT